MADRDPFISGGSGRSAGISWQQLVTQDSRSVPAFLREEVYEYAGSSPIPASRYTDAAFFQREKERMWPRIWQFAARDEDMPRPGDYVVYENVGRSYLIVRQEDGTVRAFHNVCLHRGRKLRTKDGSAQSFRCPFHGFEWNVDGSLRDMPCRWDFSTLTDSKMGLPHAAAASWDGYIFVRESHEGPTISEFLHPLPNFFQRWPHTKRVTVAWVGKVFPANWKVTAEAFMESFHSFETHPQITPFYADQNSPYCVYNDHISMHISPFGTPSPFLGTDKRSEQWIIDEFQKSGGRSAAKDRQTQIVVPEGSTARRVMADISRHQMQAKYGRDMTEVSDTELIDSYVYNVFPNFSPWGGFLPSIVYRWRPWPDHRATLMEVRLLQELEPSRHAGEPLGMHFLGDDETWASAPELGDLGPVFDQDMSNLGLVQEGLEASKNGLVQLADYQEIRIRRFHQTLDKYLALPPD